MQNKKMKRQKKEKEFKRDDSEKYIIEVPVAVMEAAGFYGHGFLNIEVEKGKLILTKAEEEESDNDCCDCPCRSECKREVR